MKRILAPLLLVLSLALVAAPAVGQETKAAPKVEVKAPASGAPAASLPASTAAVAPAPLPAAVAAPGATVAAPAELPWWKVLIRYGMELIFTILGILASVFVTVLMKKYGFEDYTAKVNDVLSRGIGFAEQKSLQALKLNGKPLGSAEKLALALEFIGDKAKEYKLPDKGKAWWEKKVEGWLGVQNMSNGSSTSTNG